MAGVACYIPFNFSSNLRRIHGPRCCSVSPEKKTPAVVKWAVSGVTEFLRLFSATDKDRLKESSNISKNEINVRDTDDLMMILESDYENAYFVTGLFTSAIYADDCLFEDPTISFNGTDLYERNLKLLVPFLENPSIELQKMEKTQDEASKRNSILATWKLRTYLKLPWKPLISINGSTVYELGKDFKIVRHVESWDVSALEAIAQIFTLSS